MADDIPEIEDNPKEALRSFIRELETFYYPWYDRATTRNYYAWFAAQALSLLSGFATAILAVLLGVEQFKSWGSEGVQASAHPEPSCAEEDRRGTAGQVGQGEGAAKEGCLAQLRVSQEQYGRGLPALFCTRIWPCNPSLESGKRPS